MPQTGPKSQRGKAVSRGQAAAPPSLARRPPAQRCEEAPPIFAGFLSGFPAYVRARVVGPPPARYMPPPSYAPPVTFPSTSPPPPAAPPSGPSDPAEALRQLDDLRAKNLITDEEYQAKRKAILDRL
jgi:Short C-terminal domain